MSRILMFSSIGVILFSLAAGTSWYLQLHNQDAEGPSVAGEKPTKTKSAKSAKDAKDAAAAGPLVHAPLSADADRLTQISATLQTQHDALKSREQLIATREKQLDLIHEEIKKEQKKLDSVRKQIETELLFVQGQLDLLEKKTAENEKDRQQARAELSDIKQATLQMNGYESKNLKQVSGIYDKMDPDAAAQSIRQMVDKGKLDTAVSILAGMRDRQAANLLGLISEQDASIATQLFDRMRYMKPATEAPK